jgi:regulatory protein YycI of two-component signal transduction system YycFG
MVSKEKTERMVQTNRQHAKSSANLNVRLNSIVPIRDFNYVQQLNYFIESNVWDCGKYQLNTK